MNKSIKTTNLEKTLNKISTEEQLNAYIKDTKDFTYPTFLDYFYSLSKVKSLDKAKLVKKSGLERTYCYHILNGTKEPGRDKILCLCIAAQLNVQETNRALKSAHCAQLYVKDNRDAIIQYAIKKQLTIPETNELLSKHDLSILL